MTVRTSRRLPDPALAKPGTLTRDAVRPARQAVPRLRSAVPAVPPLRTAGPRAAGSGAASVLAAFVLDAWLGVPTAPGVAARPRSLLAADRLAAVSRGIGRGLLLAVAGCVSARCRT
jgi:hypothetical protein